MFTADGRAAVRATIGKQIDLTIIVASGDEFPASHPYLSKIADIGYFAFMQHVYPSRGKNMAHLLREDTVTGVDARVNAVVLYEPVPIRIDGFDIDDFIHCLIQVGLTESV